MSSPAVLSLKKQALAHKQQGDLERAKDCLRQAKRIEVLLSSSADAAVAQIQELIDLLQKNGDEAGAQRIQKQQKLMQLDDNMTESNKNTSSTTDEPTRNINNNTENTGTLSTSSTTTDNDNDSTNDNVMEDPVNQAMDEANLQDLHDARFTNEELLDVDILVEMHENGMVAALPDPSEYTSRIMDCKRAALQAKKDGDLAAAKRHLLMSKQLDQAMGKLQQAIQQQQQAKNNHDDNDIENDQDYHLLQELMRMDDEPSGGNIMNDQGYLEGLYDATSAAASSILGLDDNDDDMLNDDELWQDPDMVRDMIKSGIITKLPSLNKITDQAKKRKTMAIQYKNKGDLVSAKQALDESKKLEHRARIIQELQQNEHDNAGKDEIQDPEALLRSMEEMAAQRTTSKTTDNEKAPESSSSLSQLKSSHEYKVLAVQYKQEGDMQQAVATLRLYKQALAAEAQAQWVQQRDTCLQTLTQEYELAVCQVRLFYYYERFVNADCAQEQIQLWKAHAQECQTAVEELKEQQSPRDPSNTPLLPTLERDTAKKLLEIQDTTHLKFVATSIDPTEERIELCVLDLFDLKSNKNLQPLLKTETTTTKAPLVSVGSIHVQVMVQLPPNMENPDDNVELVYRPVSLQDNDRFVFGPSQFIHAEHGTSRFARLLSRRMARRKILLNVYHTTTQGILFSKTTQARLLGCAVIELKELLAHNMIANEFCLLDEKRRRPVGGSLRCVVRTGCPFVDQQTNDTTTNETDGAVVDDEQEVLRPFAAVVFPSS